MRTMEVRNSGYQFQNGWQIATIAFAQYGDWNGVKYIDVYFEKLPETMNMRVWATHNKVTGEEFAIGNLFRFANAGIREVESDGNGRKVVKIDDRAELLTGKKLNIFLFRDGSGYFRILPRAAPAEPFVNVLEDVSEDHIQYWKDRAKFYLEYFVRGRSEVKSESTPF